METLDLEKLSIKKPKDTIVIDRGNEKLPRHKHGEKFLKGPVPLVWLAKAGALPGKSLHVANALWFLAGVKNTRTVRLPNSLLKQFGVNRSAKYRALDWLEKAMLISVVRKSGCNAVVTLLDVSASE